MTIAKNTNKAKQAIANAHDIRCFSLSNNFKAFLCAYIECPAEVVDDLQQRFQEYLAALLDQHAVAETSLKEFLETESGKMMLLSLKTIGIEFLCDQAGPGWRLLPQHAAEQPKLTGAQLKELAYTKCGLQPAWMEPRWQTLAEAISALLTSPVAPPPQQKEKTP